VKEFFIDKHPSDGRLIGNPASKRKFLTGKNIKVYDYAKKDRKPYGIITLTYPERNLSTNE